MPRDRHGAWVAALAATALLVPAVFADRQAKAALVVFAAASLTEAFSDLGARFERRTGTPVRFHFAGSQQLATQIEHGALADVFASADQRWMAYVTERQRTAGEPALFARNRLVVIVPRTNPGRVDRLEHLARRGLKLVLCADAVPAGRYARLALHSLARASGFGAEYARRVLANVVSEEESVRGVLSKVQLGEADAGMVYRSDVTRAARRDVRILEIPAGHGVLADYPIAVLRAAPRADQARAFVELVLGAEGQEVLGHHGLIPTGAAAP
jgi:molybdate transport system substrate-binding protein